MKKVFFAISMLFCLSSFAQQDSSLIKITVSPQARDIEYISSIFYNNNDIEDFYDTVKSKFRVQNPPVGFTTVAFAATLQDWYVIFQRLINEPIALKSGCTTRIEALLRATGQSYLITKLNNINTSDTDSFQSMRIFGRNRLRKQ